MRVRPETAEDFPAIRALTQASFHEANYGWDDAANALDRMRLAGSLALSLVALNMDEAVIGHIAFSPITVSDGTTGWFDLAPLSVMATRQRTGIGGSLIVRGVAEMRAAGARGIVVMGDPAYYSRFGFQPVPDLTLQGAPTEWLLALPLEGEAPSGAIRLSPGFLGSP
ncbi:GNAT family N-acetyltransferase [Erythrobacter sp. 3-20A1M]|uniref:GNAT family N-acetyltransferase n=1 Tax=Erythrobacter sp. 3-20A1M TaxID=2653850 RepID=UPI001BFC7EEA|nr:N-acetyltransferase [Erythrobacter sp. 3-20A1M]QWC56666.1 GNAT family N-acetyltransferase [Erythrobacter sp. 3-20A1M]